jgi:lipoprotein-anchoring transpeptidase ErfK/SrfK
MLALATVAVAGLGAAAASPASDLEWLSEPLGQSVAGSPAAGAESPETVEAATPAPTPSPTETAEGQAQDSPRSALTPSPPGPSATPSTAPAVEPVGPPQPETESSLETESLAESGGEGDTSPETVRDRDGEASEDAPGASQDDATKAERIAAAQRKLAEAGYYPGNVDGEAGPRTSMAVMAFQKVNNLSVDGVLGPNTQQALRTPRKPELRGGPPTRIEVNLSKQVLYWVEDGELKRIMPVSSGNGETYTTDDGGTARALTPAGHFEIERRVEGLRDAPLGVLYNPMYFLRGWAIHGSNSVPAYPASHGCVRLPRWDAAWLFDQAPNGTDVYLYGGEHTFSAGSDAAGTDTPAA